MLERVFSYVRRSGSTPRHILEYEDRETGGVDVNLALSAWDADVLQTAVGEPPTEPGDEADQWWADYHDAVSRQDGPEPITQRTEHNTTCYALHNYLLRGLNPTTPNASMGATIDLAFGEGTSVSPAVSDTELVNKQAEYAVSGYDADEGARQVQLRCVLSTDQGNDLTISEVGLLGPNGLWNHAGIAPPVEKTNSIALTVEILISVLDASEVSG